jgi:hypothetical protein
MFNGIEFLQYPAEAHAACIIRPRRIDMVKVRWDR